MKHVLIALVMLMNGSVAVVAQDFQPDPTRIANMMLSEMATRVVDDTPYLTYLDSGLEEARKSDRFLGLAGKDLVAGFGSNILIIRCDFTPTP